jgi:hypothetical protein
MCMSFAGLTLDLARFSKKSVTGVLLNYDGGCVAYKSKMQATVATLSTEAESIGCQDHQVPTLCPSGTWS